DAAGRARKRPNSRRRLHRVGDADDPREPRGIEHELGAVERERGLGALVRVHVLVAEAVAAATGGEVVERPAKAVSAEEPVDGLARAESGSYAVSSCVTERSS